jgi:hypothetical protein
MGIPWRKCANGHAVGVLSLFFVGLLYTLIYVNPTPQLIATMGITTCALISKDKPTSRAIVTTAATPKECRSNQLAKSPRSVNINSLLAEINLPTNRFDNVLQALRLSTNPTDNNPNNPCNLTLPTDKNMQVNQLASPTGMDVMATVRFNTPVDNKSPQANKSPQHQTTPPSKSVQINKTATLVNHTVNTSGGVSQGHESILLSTGNSNPPTPNPEPEGANPTSENNPSEIYDRTQMLY